MSTPLPLVTILILLTLTAGGYSIATVGMKLASAGTTPVSLFVISAGLICAAMAEIALLRDANIAVIYLGIVALESFMVIVFAMMIGERLAIHQLAGAALVLGGFVLVSQSG